MICDSPIQLLFDHARPGRGASAAEGTSTVAGWHGNRGQGHAKMSPSVDRCVHKVRNPVEARRVPRIGRHEIGDVGKRHAARRIGPGV